VITATPAWQGRNPTPSPREEGEYPEGDYGRAGTVGQELPGDEEGEYPEGDYGGAGTAPEGGAAEELKNDDGGTSSGG
jgi:hypothetical protein